MTHLRIHKAIYFQTLFPIPLKPFSKASAPPQTLYQKAFRLKDCTRKKLQSREASFSLTGRHTLPLLRRNIIDSVRLKDKQHSVHRRGRLNLVVVRLTLPSVSFLLPLSSFFCPYVFMFLYRRVDRFTVVMKFYHLSDTDCALK